MSDEMFTRYIGVFCSEKGCGSFIQIGDPYSTPYPRHFVTDLTLDGEVLACHKGHRHQYYSADVVQASSGDGANPHYSHKN